MTATIVTAAALACLVALAVRKRARDFKTNGFCGGCRGCLHGTCSVCRKEGL